MFIITGATGNTGAVAANALLDAGKQVGVVVRNAEKAKALAARGARVIVAELDDTAALTKAFAGAEGVYVISPPNLGSADFVAEATTRAQHVADAVRAARPAHVVLLSSVAAQQPSGTGIIASARAFELALRAAGAPLTIVRASYFMENWAGVLPVVKQDGVLPSFLPAQLAIPMVASRDIGTKAASVLLEGARKSDQPRVIELSGPTTLSANDVASAAGRVLGREVKVVEAPLSAVVPTFGSFGASQNVAGLYRDMFEGLANGRVVPEAGNETASGKTSIEALLRELLR